MGHVRFDRAGAHAVSKRSWRHQFAIGCGFLLSALFLWLALRKVDWRDLGAAFASINYFPVLGCVGALSLSIVLRAVRWRVIAQSPASEHRNFLRATNLGLLTNLLFPARAGEVIRVVTLARLLHSSFPRPLASALIDRLVDVFVLIVSASVLFWFLPIATFLDKWFTIFLIVAGIAVVLIILFARNSGWGEALGARLAKRWLRRWSVQPEIFLAELRLEFRRMLGGWLSVKLVVLAALVLCADYGAILTLLLAFGLLLPLEAPLLLWVFLSAGSALPSAPGYVGVYQVATIWALSLFSVSASMSVAIATVLQVATLVVALIIAGPGALSIFKRMLFVRNPT